MNEKLQVLKEVFNVQNNEVFMREAKFWKKGGAQSLCHMYGLGIL
jgi:hypothetical protein